MPRYARKIAESGVYHVMLRGINRQDIFEDEEDYQRMLDSFRHLPQQYDVKGERKGDTCCLYAYCLMPNHVHLLLRTLDWTIGEVVKSLADAYAMYFNMKYGRVGHLFQGRFKSEPCDTMGYFVTLVRYIHQNPVKAGLSPTVDYRWSSWQEYCLSSEARICRVEHLLKRMTFEELKEWVERPVDDEAGCLDVETQALMPRKMLLDEAVRALLLALAEVANVAEFQRLPLVRRKLVVRQLKERGAGVRQLVRITGMPLSTASKW